MLPGSLLIAAWCTFSLLAVDRPNVVVILADDLDCVDNGCNNRERG